ncbi:hypothetical protein [Nigerium massiliense]|uniref:hypothetical protein n=1 Tax=Nigerium massiliense TaxID=1522317 RepID=UPI00058DD571|nr:hypothetical protein [Nigerium massiliense]
MFGNNTATLPRPVLGMIFGAFLALTIPVTTLATAAPLGGAAPAPFPPPSAQPTTRSTTSP